MRHTVHKLKLANGTEGLLIHVPDASVMTYEFNFRAGEYLVEKSKWETAHIMEHMLLGANQFIPKARAFQAEFEKNGAYSNASTGSYDIIYEAECADFEWDRILDMLLIAITKPLFLQEEFEAEFGNVREELTARSNNHFRHLSLALRKQYGFHVLTDQDRLGIMENVILNDITEHYKKTHTTSNLRFVMAGNLNAERRRSVEQILANIELPKGEGRTDLPDEHPKHPKKPLHIKNRTVDNLYFYLDTFAGRRLTDAQSDNLSLINTMLTETLYSKILGTAREKGLVYSMSSGIGQSKNSANWWFGAQVMPKNAPALFDIMVHELSEVFAGNISDEDIESAKQYALGRYQRSGQTVGGTANGYSYRYFFDGHVDDYYKVPERIEAITKRGIITVSKSMFTDNIWGLGALGSASPALIKELQQQAAPLWQGK
ncbi:insulinase family protein [Candidatus Saccharibacteria bacterium]|nr:MAG: insulinase family protein [Candidatus Saccharibacteria bacterium]